MPEFLPKSAASVGRPATRFAAALLTLLLPLVAAAHEYRAGELTIEHPWSRATAAGATIGAGYMLLRNAGHEADVLLGASSPVAERVEFHSSSNDGGVMKMRQLARVEIAGGATLRLVPGGLHMMLIGLRAPLVAGQKVPLLLRFQKGGEQKVDLKVEPADTDVGPDGRVLAPAGKRPAASGAATGHEHH